MWDLSCIDWEERIRSGRSLIPELPLFAGEAAEGLAIFDRLRLPDVPGLPRMAEACGEWFRDLVRVVFGSLDPATRQRMVREIFLMAPKGQSKTTYDAGLMLTALVMNDRPRAKMLFVAPTQAISERSFDQAAGMIEADRALQKLFKVKDHLKEIEHRDNHATLNVKTFAADILTGSMPVMVMLDELHLLSHNPHAAKVIRQIRGGLEKNTEGMLIVVTTQSDEPPAGAFRDELMTARKIRDGRFKGQTVRAMLPILYEFPESIAREPAQWQDPENWRMVMPNLGRSVRLDSLIKDWETERQKGEKDVRIWASQHLNIEVGIGLKTDAWRGADHWASSEDPALADLDLLLARSEAVVVGIDGGGLDDLFGLYVIGRERQTRHWLGWGHAWCDVGVLDVRKTIAPRLKDFEAAGNLTIAEDGLDDISAIVEIVADINARGLLAGVAVDPEAIGELVDALAEVGITEESGLLLGVRQGWGLMNAIKTSERKLRNGTLRHAPQPLLDWCVGNVRIEAMATAIRATKQNAGDAKIDPVIALFNAAMLMSKNPEPQGPSVYASRGILVI